MNLARVLAAVLVPVMVVPPPSLFAQPRLAAKPVAPKAEAAKSDAQLDGYSKAASDKERGWET